MVAEASVKDSNTSDFVQLTSRKEEVPTHFGKNLTHHPRSSRKSSVSTIRPLRLSLSVKIPIIRLTKRRAAGMLVAANCRDPMMLCSSVREQERLLTQSFRRLDISEFFSCGLRSCSIPSREKLLWCLDLRLCQPSPERPAASECHKTLNKSVALAGSSRTSRQEVVQIMEHSRRMGL